MDSRVVANVVAVLWSDVGEELIGSYRNGVVYLELYRRELRTLAELGSRTRFCEGG